MTVLVTGAAGFIGRHVVAELARQGVRAHAVSRGEHRLDTNALWHRADLFDRQAVLSTLDRVRPTHIIHLAWDARPGLFWSSPDNLDWVAASLLLLRAFAERGGRSFVTAGSCAEDSDETLYARSKNAFRSIGERYCLDRGMRFASGRIFFPYGRGEPSEKFLSMLFERLRAGEMVELREPGRRLDFIHVDDVARAFVEINRSEERGTFDVGYGGAPTVREVAALAADLLGREPSAAIIERARTDADCDPDLIASVDRLRGIGWSPQVALRDGLETYR